MEWLVHADLYLVVGFGVGGDFNGLRQTRLVIFQLFASTTRTADAAA
jgi:hypothetical protein